MRTSTAEQLPLVPQISGHKHMDELREMSKIIDLHPQAAQLVLSDLVAGGINPKRGAKGLCGEQVIRAALIKQTNGCSYEQLAFHLTDSLSYRAFCRLGFSDTLSSSTLQDNVKKIRPETLEEINRTLIGYAKDVGVKDWHMIKSSWAYRKLRRFCIGIESNMSFLKQSFGWSRCTWRSLTSFKSYTLTSVVAANLLTLARHALQ